LLRETEQAPVVAWTHERYETPLRDFPVGRGADGQVVTLGGLRPTALLGVPLPEGAHPDLAVFAALVQLGL
jgi:hypothetical protein